MEIEVMEQFINSDCFTWKTSSPSTLLFTAYNKKYLELHNKSVAVTINKKICRSVVFVLLFLVMQQENRPPSSTLNNRV